LDRIDTENSKCKLADAAEANLSGNGIRKAEE
jgi:hypothetical protein